MKNLKTLQNLILSISTLVFLSISNSAYATSHEFITTWKTDADGESIIIPTHIGSTYSYTIDCGDGGLISGANARTASGQNGNATCVYATAGDDHEIRITGVFPRIYTFNAVSKDKLITVEQWGTVGWDSMATAFAGATKLTNVPNNTTGLTGVQSMTAMFSGASMFNADISDWNVSAITTTTAMFFNASAFNQDIGNWNVSAVTNMESMFNNANAFNGNIVNWDVGAVTNMKNMFFSAEVFNQNIGNWNVSSVTDMSSMFTSATDFEQNLGKWYIVPTPASLFNTVGANLEINAQNAFLDGTHPLNGQSPVYAISDETNFSISGNTLTLHTPDPDATSYELEISASGDLFGTNNQRRLTIAVAATVATDAFVSTWKTDTNGESITIITAGSGYNYQIDCGEGGLITSSTGANIRILAGQIGNSTCVYATAGTYEVRINGTFPRIHFDGTAPDRLKLRTVEQWGDVGWDSMEGAFFGVTGLTSVPNNTTGLENVRDMSSMFSGASAFNADIGNWDVRGVTNMRNMFSSARVFNQDIGNWNVAAVTDMSYMFNESILFNQNIGNWDIRGVTNMRNMFSSARVFNQDIGNWNVRGVTNMRSMFSSANVFNQDIGNWNVGAVDDMTAMFANARVFNQDIGNWDVRGVTNMRNMFASAIVFNQDISDWGVRGVTDMSNMFNNAAGFDQDISDWDVRAANNMENMFNNATAFSQNLGDWYIVPSSNSIATNTAGATLTISAQNAFLARQSPTYAIVGGADMDKFRIDGNILTLNTADANFYVLEISASGDLFGTNNQRRLIITDAANSFNLDIDGDGSLGITTDGALILRFILRPTDLNTTEAVEPDRSKTRTDEEILEYLQDNTGKLDIDGDGNLGITTDGALILRFILRPTDLNTTEAVEPDRSKTRTDEEILEYLKSLAP